VKDRYLRALKLLSEHGWLLLIMGLLLRLPLEIGVLVFGEQLAALPLLQIVLGMVWLLLPPYFAAVIIAALDTYHAGRYATLPSAMAEGARGYIRTLQAYALTMLAMLITLPLFLLPSLYVGTRLAFALPVALLERSGGVAAVKRSWQLSKGRELDIAACFAVALLSIAVAIATERLGPLPGSSAFLPARVGSSVLQVFLQVAYFTLIVDYYRELVLPKPKGGSGGESGEVLYKPLDEMVKRED